LPCHHLPHLFESDAKLFVLRVLMFLCGGFLFLLFLGLLDDWAGRWAAAVGAVDERSTLDGADDFVRPLHTAIWKLWSPELLYLKSMRQRIDRFVEVKQDPNFASRHFGTCMLDNVMHDDRAEGIGKIVNEGPKFGVRNALLQIQFKERSAISEFDVRDGLDLNIFL
jgi:hypothetical protein